MRMLRTCRHDHLTRAIAAPFRLGYCHQQTTTRCIIVGAGASGNEKKTTVHRHAHHANLKGVHPEHIYRIINDVDSYKDFLPYCNESKVLRTSDCGTMYDAVLGVGLPMPGHLMEERYVSRVRASSQPFSDENNVDGAGGMKPTWMVEAKSIRSSSFDSLKSRWVLTFAVGDEFTVNDRSVGIGEDISCDVNFDVEIRVSNILVSFVLDGVIGEVARKQVEAFERRANEVPFR